MGKRPKFDYVDPPLLFLCKLVHAPVCVRVCNTLLHALKVGRECKDANRDRQLDVVT